jgi:uncharacterized protein YegL
MPILFDSSPVTRELINKNYQAVISQVNGIQVEVHPLYSAYPEKGYELVMPVLVNLITGPIPERENRDPLNLCVVLDRSGSMSGCLSQAKNAIKQMLGLLNTNDYISFVVYDDRIDTVFEGVRIDDSTNFAELEAKIDNVKHRGTTNISGALQQGVNTVVKFAETNHKKAVFLFSDGEANAGVTDVDELGSMVVNWNKEQNVYFSAFGIGTQYNERLMRGIGRCGKGTYGFIQGTEETLRFLKRGLKCMTSDLATECTLQVVPTGETRIVATNDTFMTTVKGRTMSTLKDSNVLQFMYPVVLGSGESGIKVKFTCNFPEYVNLPSEMQTIEIDYTFSRTSDPSSITESAEVLGYLAVQKAGELELEVTKYVNSGNYEAAVATKRQVVATYENVVGTTAWFKPDMLYFNAVDALSDLETNGISASAVKKQNMYANYACAAAGVSVCDALNDNFEDEESDEDMGGFGLFD